jgi:phosphoribosylformimino-5-aminoimidazole carboxamide ribonucleotide (ProFAR) isomerase
MTRFRPCIDVHSGQVKQIVGGTLSTSISDLKTNHISTHSAAHFASLYRQHDCRGGHVIMLGPGNEKAAKEALATWPNALQIGGGITDQNAWEWIESGAEKVTPSIIFIFVACNPTNFMIPMVSGSPRGSLVVDTSEGQRKRNTDEAY